MTKRLEELSKRIPECEVLLDVGCDHGYVTYDALKSGKAKRAICSDLSEPSLQKAKKLISGEFPDTVFSVADGVPDGVEFDFTVIAGMGGEEIIKILKNTDKVNCALFQPMNRLPYFRSGLVGLGFRIISDELVSDGKFYNVIVARKGEDFLTEDEILFGRTNLEKRTEDFSEYLVAERKKNVEILKGIERENPRYAEISSYIERIDRLL